MKTSLGRALATLVLAVALFPTPRAALAQDQFGFSVAIGNGEALVMKAFAGRGPAAVYVFKQRADGTWYVGDELRPAVAGETGEGFGPSVALAGTTLLASSGDPSARRGSHVFSRDASGAWVESTAIPLVSEPELSSSGALDLASIMRILQPPRRVVALDGDRAAVAVVGAPPGSGKLRILERQDNSAVWQERASLDPTEGSSNDQFGSALALGPDRVAVGAPRHAESGAVFVFARDAATGRWHEEAKLTASGLALESRFGTALAFDGEDILVGAPGTDQSGGAVVTFSRDAASGEWRERGRTVPANGTAGDRFGYAMDIVGDELWVGAPRALERRGIVYRFRRDGTTGAWRAADLLAAPDLESGFRIGASVVFGGAGATRCREGIEPTLDERSS